jgi:hypothetical protein
MSAIKGTALESVIDDVNRLVDEGRFSRDDLEIWLLAPDLELLDRKINSAGWYPIDSYGRLSDLLMQHEGQGQSEYLVERGRRAAERLKASGIYSQLSADRQRWGDRLGAIMASIGPAMFKDSEWSFEQASAEAGASQRFKIHVRVTQGFPEAGRHAAQGFIDFLSNQSWAEGDVQVESRRLSDTELEFSALEA